MNQKWASQEKKNNQNNRTDIKFLGQPEEGRKTLKTYRHEEP